MTAPLIAASVATCSTIVAELRDHRLVDDVHRAAGHVPGDERDAVGVDVELEVGHGGRSLRSARRLSTASPSLCSSGRLFRRARPSCRRPDNASVQLFARVPISMQTAHRGCERLTSSGRWRTPAFQPAAVARLEHGLAARPRSAPPRLRGRRRARPLSRASGACDDAAPGFSVQRLTPNWSRPGRIAEPLARAARHALLERRRIVRRADVGCDLRDVDLRHVPLPRWRCVVVTPAR